MRLHLVTAPAEEPITLAEVKTHRRVTGPDEDGLLTGLIAAARQLFEDETGRQVVTATWRGHLDRFPECGQPIVIPKAPLLTVTGITYIDTAGVTQTWSSSEYTVATYAGAFARPGYIYPAPEYVYPSVYDVKNAVAVTFTAGYGAAAAVPEGVKAAIKNIVGDLYEEREHAIIGTSSTENAALTRYLSRFKLPVYA